MGETPKTALAPLSPLPACEEGKIRFPPRLRGGLGWGSIFMQLHIKLVLEGIYQRIVNSRKYEGKV